MKIKLTLVTALAICSLTAAGCGGGESSSDTKEDEAAVTALIAEINQVTKERDAQGFCAIMQPSGVKATFNTHATCVRETKGILEQSPAETPTLEVESISIDGDQATVDFKSNAGGAPVDLVKEGGKWYIPLSTGEVDSATTDSGPGTSSE